MGGHRRLCVGAVCGRMAPRKFVSRSPRALSETIFVMKIKRNPNDW